MPPMAASVKAAPALYGPLLFTPGDRPDRFEKGWTASGGALILDLEDGVAPERKAAARKAVADWISPARRPLVRLNAMDTAAFSEDAAALSGVEVPMIVLAKTQSADDVKAVRAVWPRAALFPLIESPEGLARLAEIAAAPGVAQLAFGALDLHAAVGMRFPESSFIAHCRIQITLASRIARLAAPIDSPFPGFKDAEAVAADAQSASALGFAAKLCIHPAQLGPVRDAFRPTSEEIAWAREVVAAGAAGGAASVRGAMVDAPVLASARQVLERDERLRHRERSE